MYILRMDPAAERAHQGRVGESTGKWRQARETAHKVRCGKGARLAGVGAYDPRGGEGDESQRWHCEQEAVIHHGKLT